MAIEGVKILASDLAWDVYDDFFERYDAGREPSVVKAELIGEYEREILSEVDREIFLTTLAECLWSVGHAVEDLREQIRELVESETTAEFWAQLYSDRRKALKRLLSKLQKPKKSPVKPRRNRLPKKLLFEEGDYLAFAKRNGKKAPVIMWCVDRTGGLSYEFIFPNLTRTADASLIQKFLDTNLPITDDELATFFSKNKRTRSVEINHKDIKAHMSRFQKFGNRKFDFRVWQGSSFGSCPNFESFEKCVDEGGSRGLSPEELQMIGC